MDAIKRLVGLGVLLLLAGCGETVQSEAVKLPENPKWVNVATAEDGKEFGVDSNSIDRTGSLIMFFQRMKVTQPDESGTSVYASWKVLDCETRIGKMLSLTQVNSEGDILSSERSQDPGEETKSLKGSTGEAIDEYVCSRPASGSVTQEPSSVSPNQQAPMSQDDNLLQRELILREQQHRQNLELQGQRLRAEQSRQFFRNLHDRNQYSPYGSPREFLSQPFGANPLNPSLDKVHCTAHVKPDYMGGQKIETDCD